MSTEIKITTIPDGFAIHFPFLLKDTFKAAFPSSHWDNYSRTWTVGPRSGKRLEEWAELARHSGVLEKLDEMKAANLSQAELDALANAIERVENDIDAKLKQGKTIAKTRELIAQSRAVLEAAKAKLVKVSAQVTEQEASKIAEIEAINETLTAIIDIPALKKAMAKMASNANVLGQRAREMHYEAQEEICEARNALRRAGLRLDALDFLAKANFNRPDRDHPKFMRDDAWISISKYKPAD